MLDHFALANTFWDAHSVLADAVPQLQNPFVIHYEYLILPCAYEFDLDIFIQVFAHGSL